MPSRINNLLLVASLVFLFGAAINSQAQIETQKKYHTIEQLISYQQKTGGMFDGLLGAQNLPAKNAELMNLSQITFPNSVKVEYLAETRKLGKIRKRAVDKWLKDFSKTPADKKFYLSETLVAENGANYWIIVKESVLEKLKGKSKNDSVVLKMQILGSYRKGAAIDYFLLADELE